MTDGDVLLAAIRANPDDDTPRLIYADWCDENGQSDEAYYQRARIAVRPVLADPDDDDARLTFADWAEGMGHRDRAELIRKQIFLARKPPCPDWCDHDPAKCTVTWLGREVDRLLSVARKDVWCGNPQFELTPHMYTSAGAPWGNWWRACVRRGLIERVFVTGSAWIEHADHLLAHNPVTHAFLERLPPIGFGGDDGLGSRNCCFIRTDGTKLPEYQFFHVHFPDVARERIAAKLAEAYWPSVAVTFRA